MLIVRWLTWRNLLWPLCLCTTTHTKSFDTLLYLEYFSYNNLCIDTSIIWHRSLYHRLVMSDSIPSDFKSLHTILLLDILSYPDGSDWKWSYQLSNRKSWVRSFPDGMHWIYDYRKNKRLFLTKAFYYLHATLLFFLLYIFRSFVKIKMPSGCKLD